MAPLMIFAFSAFILVMIAHFTFGNGEGAPWRPLAETGSGRAP